MDTFTGGVFTHDGQFVKDSLLHRGSPGVFCQPDDYVNEICIYGGCLFAHFGHFIWESLSRLYTIRKCKNYPIVFISPNNKIFKMYQLYINTLGIKNEIRLIQIPTMFKNLIYSQPGSSLSPLFILDEQMMALQYINNYDSKKYDKIWLSRSKLDMGKLVNESTIEDELQKLGFTIVHPQEFSLLEQIKIISSADIVAGCDGSAFYSLLFAKKVMGKFFIFNRRKHIPQALTYIFHKRNIPVQVHTFELKSVQEKWPVSLYYQNPEYIVNILKKV